MFENFSSKIKNLFRSKKGSIFSTKDLNSLNNGLTKGNLQRYKNLIPNLLDEFVIQDKQNKKRSGSFSSKNNKFILSEKKLVHSNSGLFLKIKKKKNIQADIRLSIGRHYFLGKTEDSKLASTKNLRRVSYMQENIMGKLEKNATLRDINIDISKNKPKLKRKRTLDPDDTKQANNIQFEFGEKKEKETMEKLEKYQEKMRKTQLRYYVFKKITNYKSSLRKYFQKYRTIVQLMDVIEEKNDDSNESKIEKENKRIKILKNILKNRVYKEQKELNKFFLRFYYNGKYAAGMANLNKILKDKKGENNKEDTNVNNDIVTNNNNQNINDNNNNPNFLNAIKGEIKKEEEKKELTPEEIERAKRKRNKELRDLFYNKVRERQKWLHDHFVKFYFRGLLLAMKTGTIKNNTSSSSETKPEPTNQIVENQTTNNPNENDLTNKTSSEIDTLNINKEIEKNDEKKEEKTEEEKKEEEEKKNKKIAFNKIRDRSKGLRKLLSEKNKEKTNLLRKYFFKFLSNGVLLSLKKTTLKSTKSLKNYVEDSTNKEEDENKKKEEEEKNWIIEEKKRRKLEEEKRLNELMESRKKILSIIINRKDQIICGTLRGGLQKWNLRAKILSIGDLTVGFRQSKKGKGKKKTKKKEKKNKEIKENEEQTEEQTEENKEQNENK